MSVRNYGPYPYLSTILFTIIGITGTLICIWLSKLIQKTILGKALEFVGKNTIVLVALHIFVLTVVENITSHFITIDADNKVLYLLYGYSKVVLVVILCLLKRKKSALLSP